MNKVNVTIAEQQLKEAKAAARADEQETLKKQLAAVRDDIRTARRRYTALRSTIKAGEQAVAIQQSHVDGLVNLLTEHMQARPGCAEFLPDDLEVKAWQKRYDDLCKRRDLAIARREEIRNGLPNVLECAKYEGNFGVIANLERAEANMIRRLKGERIGGGHEGGVFRVL